ncbi:Heme a synthase [Thalictrum thalictroides]|uniref:Heme a synthase n=1 Tax=Thalictrum thalictroides TaxID=46969 RepID=A0A7J6VDC8_THATH|nr:Heme a synthase [Thalictrum thalictroides]
MVVLGGVTRLTRSGLSMNDWKFTGSLSPLSEEQWLMEFDKYKQSLEYKRTLCSLCTWCWAGFDWLVDGKKWLRGTESGYVQPRVSLYRLASHLTSAFGIYCGLLWTSLSVVMPEPPAGSMVWIREAAKIKRLALPVGFLIGITAISEAFIAGNDAGHAYNTFPKMGDTWIQDDIFSMKPLLRKFCENTSTVQLDHRILATATLLSIGTLWRASRG